MVYSKQISALNIRILINLLITVLKVKKVHKALLLFTIFYFLSFILEVTFLSILTNNFTQKKWPKCTAAICCGTSTKDVGACGVSKKDGGARKIDGTAHRKCRLAHQSSRPNFFSTETFHRNGEDAPNAHGVAVRNEYFCVLMTTRTHEKTRRAVPRRTLKAAPTALRTAAHRILCQVKNGSLDIVLHKITLIWCLRTDKIWY